MIRKLVSLVGIFVLSMGLLLVAVGLLLRADARRIPDGLSDIQREIYVVIRDNHPFGIDRDNLRNRIDASGEAFGRALSGMRERRLVQILQPTRDQSLYILCCYLDENGEIFAVNEQGTPPIEVQLFWLTETP